MRTHALRILVLLVLAGLIIFKFVPSSNSSNHGEDAAPFGQLKEREFEGIKYCYYIPFKAGAIGDNALPLLVLIQSKQQDPAATAERWIEVAENEGVGLLIPVFNLECCKDYPHLDLRKTRIDFRFLKILDDTKNVWKFNTGQIYMYGHDEGGEFVHRFAMLYPERVKRAAVSGVSDYIFPDVSVSFPYGIKHDPELKDVKFKLDEFAKLNFDIIIGQYDNDPIRGDAAAKQGTNRVERAQNFYNAIQKYSQNNGRKSNFRLEIVPEANHEYTTTLPVAREYLFHEGQ